MNPIFSDKAPKAVGPYCHAMESKGMLYLSGQLPIEPETMKIVSDDVELQTKQCLKNISSILFEAGCSLNSVVKTTIFLRDMDNFVKINAIYDEFFGSHKPARSCIEVTRLPMDAKIEIELIAEM
ncbi:RidA family protein [Vibrio ruber]|uniref:RidA family protein n=1 Tax=Vibrio ruber TaxID=184755 RepID=UPI002892A630|nr:RidA family protein [Vibrio ruber]WNJ94289.1 RidA family protein [Vibrio ruber]